MMSNQGHSDVVEASGARTSESHEGDKCLSLPAQGLAGRSAHSRTVWPLHLCTLIRHPLCCHLHAL